MYSYFSKYIMSSNYRHVVSRFYNRKIIIVPNNCKPRNNPFFIYKNLLLNVNATPGKSRVVVLSSLIVVVVICD